jgi:ATP-binding cassette subfamily F protein uup
MAQIVSCQSVSKSYSSRPLFRNINLSLDDGERIGLIGPNGAGKSTLLKIIAGMVEPDDGTVVTRKGLQVAYVPQDEQFPAERSILEVLLSALPAEVEEHEAQTRANIMAARCGFTDIEAGCKTLSGGWRKRLSLAAQLIKEPDLLLLDEPTNHLDLDGVLWLEKLLLAATIPVVVVTHDRTFLENIANRIVELNQTYAEGHLSVAGHYSDFLLAREQYLTAQANLEQAIASKVRREIAWLQRGARARQTKAQARIDEAGRLIDELAEVKFRNAQNASVEIEFNASGRKTKELLVAKHLAKRIGGKQLFTDVSLVLAPGTRLGLLGTNGSGKTTLLKVLCGELKPDNGTIKRADRLKIVVFDQNREQLDQSKTLKEALCPTGDSVIYQGRSLHVATWARKFLFRSDQLAMPLSYLSGGEQARILIANLMLQPADVLVLDEPTNDLDIPSLEVLEESLQEFAGAIVLVTHDRFMLDTISNVILALDGRGGSGFFADYEQWQMHEQRAQTSTSAGADKREKPPAQPGGKAAGGARKRGLSTNEKRELETIDAKIEAAEKHVNALEASLLNPQIASNHVKLQELMGEIATAKAQVQALYERWEDLEKRSLEG